MKLRIYSALLSLLSLSSLAQTNRQVLIENNSGENIEVQISTRANKTFTRTIFPHSSDTIVLGKACGTFIILLIKSGQLTGQSANWSFPSDACTVNLQIDIVNDQPSVTNSVVTSAKPKKKHKHKKPKTTPQ